MLQFVELEPVSSPSSVSVRFLTVRQVADLSGYAQHPATWRLRPSRIVISRMLSSCASCSTMRIRLRPVKPRAVAVAEVDTPFFSVSSPLRSRNEDDHHGAVGRQRQIEGA